MSNEPRTKKRLNPLIWLVASIAATFLVYLALCSFLGQPGRMDRFFFLVLSTVFGVPIGLAVAMVVGLLKDARTKRGKADAERSSLRP